MAFLLKNSEDVRKIFKGTKKPIFYIANNSDKGVGLEKIIPNYHIVCIDYFDEVEYLKKSGINVFCLEKQKNKQNIIFRNSGLLMKEKEVVDYIKNNGGEKANVLVFKPSTMIEKACRKNNWKLFNNLYQDSEKFENKLNFYKIARSLGLLIPRTEILNVDKIPYESLRKNYGNFVIQLGRGFAGSTTSIIKNEENYLKFKKGNKSDQVKVSEFINGLPLTVNACATKFGTVIGAPCYQITGEKICTNSSGTTCGNDWEIFNKKLKVTYRSIAEITRSVGDYLSTAGYKGVFGLDLIFEPVTGKIYLIECNPRLVASMPMATKLEIQAGKIPLLALHILEFLGADYEIKDLELENQGNAISGAQLVLRNTEGKKCVATGNLRSGVYEFKNNKIVFLREGYSIDDIKNKEEFIVLAVSKNSIVISESECAKIRSLDSLLDDEYKLKSWVNIAAREIYTSLKLR